MSKRSHTEDEWFAKHERDLIEDLKRERLRREQRVVEALQQEEALRRKELHWMHCPKCGSQMRDETLDENVKIERCSLCGGLFFDRGELEQILLEKEAKGFRPGFMNFLLASWRTHKIDLEKALAEFHADQEQRTRMLAEKMADPLARKAKELHWMHCPKDGSEMVEFEIDHGLRLDECPLCKGIYLDFGEVNVLQAFSDEEKENVRRTLLKMGVS
jgi:Zn-finger nucleic acid-binding protein